MLKTAHPFLYSALFLIAVLILSIVVGSVFIPPQALWSIIVQTLNGRPIQDPALAPFVTIIFSLRLPRTLLMCLAGAALAGSGASYQGLFRNPLADPYLIGVATGAGLGAIIAMSLRWPYTLLGMFAIPIASFTGATLTVFIVYQLARIRRTVPTTNLILAGVAVSSFNSAVCSFIMLTSNGELRRSLTWLMGSATMSGWQPVLAMLPYVFLGGTVLIFMGHSLNVLQFGDEQAQQLGLNVRRIRLVTIIAATLVAASAVSFAGVIGFIGLIVPHINRLLWGSDYRKLIPLSLINGASILILADILARVVMAPAELPVGVITAMAGAPFFLWILNRAKQENYW